MSISWQTDCKQQHDRYEGKRIGKNHSDIEQLKIKMYLEANAVRPAEKFDDQYNFPYQGNTGSGRTGNMWCELRQDDMLET